MAQPRTAAPAAGGAVAASGQAEPANKWIGIARSVAMFLAVQTGTCHDL